MPGYQSYHYQVILLFLGYHLDLLKVTSIHFGENCFCFLQDLIITGIIQFIQLVVDLPSLQELSCDYQSLSGVTSFELRSFVFLICL